MTAFDTAALPFEERLHWQARKDWLSGRIDHSSAIVVIALWGFSIAWCGITGTIATINRAKVAAAFATNWTEALGVMAVAGLGVLAIVLAIAATVSWRRNGTSTLVLGTLPAFAGEAFEGTIEAGQIISGRNTFELSLTCERITDVRLRDPDSNSRRAKHSHFNRQQLGKVTKKVTAVPSLGTDGKFTFPVSMTVPDYYPGSLHNDDGTGIQWTLHIQSADGQSPVFGAAFEIPVYRREDLQPVE